MRLVVHAVSLCGRVEDKTRGNAHLTTICPVDMDKPFKGINLDSAGMTPVYGPGQELEAVRSPDCRFVQTSADGDWIIAGLPSNPQFEWKCIRRSEDGSGSVVWQPGASTVFSASVTSGYAGRTYGKF
jgi:hypothetical protein